MKFVDCSLSVGGEVSDEDSLGLFPSAAAVNRVGAGRWFVHSSRLSLIVFVVRPDGISKAAIWIDVEAASWNSLVTSVDTNLSLAGDASSYRAMEPMSSTR